MILADFRYNKVDKRRKLPTWIQQVMPASKRNLRVDLAIHTARQFLREMSQPVLAPPPAAAAGAAGAGAAAGAEAGAAAPPAQLPFEEAAAEEGEQAGGPAQKKARTA